MTLKIYGVLRSRASRNVWLAKELGIAFEHVPVIQAYRLADPAAPDAPLNTSSAAFRAVNPNGLIPSIDDDGFVLHESLAINLYLAKKVGGPLAPRDAQEDALMTMWSLWAATECETSTLRIQQNRRPRREDEPDPSVADAAIAALRRPFGVLDTALRDGGGFVVGRRFTVADINVAEIFRYAQAAEELFEDHPHVKTWIAACQARPAFREMWAARNAEPA
jgi:glutathione S-transferase